MIKTKITEMFGIEFPIICGAMMWICKSIHLQGRALRNETVECILETEAKGGGLEEIIPLVSGERVLRAWETGDVNAAPMMVGQSIGLIHSVPTCAELLRDMMQEAVARINTIKGNIVA